MCAFLAALSIKLCGRSQEFSRGVDTQMIKMERLVWFAPGVWSGWASFQLSGPRSCGGGVPDKGYSTVRP